MLVARELAHAGVELRVVESMHERKATMADLSDAFVALPGGIGTLEELFEVWTWSQLGIHAKPCGLLDVSGYYGALLDFLAHGVDEGFNRALDSRADAGRSERRGSARRAGRTRPPVGAAARRPLARLTATRAIAWRCTCDEPVMHQRAADLIDLLGLLPHPEGGWYQRGLPLGRRRDARRPQPRRADDDRLPPHRRVR
jgi:hypothetical protein